MPTTCRPRWCPWHLKNRPPTSDKLAAERADLQQKIRQLAEDRESFIAQKVEEAGGLESSLDKRLYEAVKEQAGKAGLEYSDGPAY